MSWYTSGKFWTFVGGVAAAGIGTAIAKAPCTRKAAVNVLAKGMELQEAAKENFQSVKDEADDLAAEARKKAQLEAALADRRAAIEARVREQVEAEMAAEEAVAEAEDESAAGEKKATGSRTSAAKAATAAKKTARKK